MRTMVWYFRNCTQSYHGRIHLVYMFVRKTKQCELMILSENGCVCWNFKFKLCHEWQRNCIEHSIRLQSIPWTMAWFVVVVRFALSIFGWRKRNKSSVYTVFVIWYYGFKTKAHIIIIIMIVNCIYLFIWCWIEAHLGFYITICIEQIYRPHVDFNIRINILFVCARAHILREFIHTHKQKQI